MAQDEKASAPHQKVDWCSLQEPKGT